MNTQLESKFENYAYLVLDELTTSFKLTDREIETLSNALSFQIVCATPFLADCSQALHNAVLHAGMYIQAMRNPALFSLKAGESYEERIELGMRFPDGNPEVIEHAGNLLKLISLNDYYFDQEIDKDAGKYNPISNGDVKYFFEKQKIYEFLEKSNSSFGFMFPPIPNRSGWQ